VGNFLLLLASYLTIFGIIIAVSEKALIF